MIRSTWVVARREVLAFFVSPLAYVVLAAWMVWKGLEFTILAIFASGQAGGTSVDFLRSAFGGTTLFYMPILVFVPVLTMRLLAEESRQGTIEALLTAPVSSAAVVLGKYLAALVFWVALWTPTLMYVWITSRFGDIDAGHVAAIFLGIFGIGVYYMALGLLMSAVAKSQISAAVLTFMALGFLFMVGIVQFLPLEEDLLELSKYVSVWQHMQAFASGIIDTRYLVYDVSVAALAVFFSVQIIESRRYAS